MCKLPEGRRRYKRWPLIACSRVKRETSEGSARSADINTNYGNTARCERGKLKNRCKSAGLSLLAAKFPTRITVCYTHTQTGLTNFCYIFVRRFDYKFFNIHVICSAIYFLELSNISSLRWYWGDLELSNKYLSFFLEE